MSPAQLVKSNQTSRFKAASVVTMQHGINLPLAAGAGSSNDHTTQGDCTFRRSQRFKSKVLPYWDFVRIACNPTSKGNKTFISCDVPGEGMVESTVKNEPYQTKLETPSKNKPSKRKNASQDVSIECNHSTGLSSKRSRVSSTASNSTPNKTRLSVTPKKRRLFSFGSDFLEGQSNVVNGECLTSGKKSSSPRTLPPMLDKIKPVISRSSKNINKSSTSSSRDGTCETRDVDKPNDADEAGAADKVGNPDKGKSKMDCPYQEKSVEGCDVIIERISEDCADGGSISSPAAAASLGRLPSLDDPGYSTGNDSFASTMAGSELRFATLAGSENDNAASTGQYHIARGVAKNGISVYFIHLSKGYIAFRTPLKTVFIGMCGEGYLKLINENKPTMQMKLRPDTEVSVDKDAVVAIGCQEDYSNLTVVMVTMVDCDTNNGTSKSRDIVTPSEVV